MTISGADSGSRPTGQAPTGLDASRIDPGDLPRCYNCLGPAAVEDGLCRDCFDEINGQFGVGS